MILLNTMARLQYNIRLLDATDRMQRAYTLDNIFKKAIKQAAF